MAKKAEDALIKSIHLNQEIMKEWEKNMGLQQKLLKQYEKKNNRLKKMLGL